MHGCPPQQYITRTYDLYTWVNQQTKWSKVQCLTKQCDRRGMNPRPPDPELEVLTAQPAHTTCLLPYIILPFKYIYDSQIFAETFLSG